MKNNSMKIHKYKNGRFPQGARLQADDYLLYVEERRVYRLVPSSFGHGIGGLKWERADAETEDLIIKAARLAQSVIDGVGALAGSLAAQNQAAIEWHDANKNVCSVCGKCDTNGLTYSTFWGEWQCGRCFDRRNREHDEMQWDVERTQSDFLMGAR